jgi:hypothetical protein
MGVVELDGDPGGERTPVRVAPAEAPDEVGQRAGDEEVLLDEAQALPHARGVVGIEHAGEGLRGEPLREGPHEVARAEGLEVEEVRGAGGPQPKSIDGIAPVSHHRAIEWQAEQARGLAGHDA